MNIKSMLRGISTASPQTVGNMTVIPLVLDSIEEDLRFAPPNRAGYDTNRGYGIVTATNKTDDKTVLLPSQLAILTQQAAQNHALMSAAFVKVKEAKTIYTAACIQQTQGGHIRDSEDNELYILPYLLRETALTKRKESSYNKLWVDIARFNSLAKCAGASGGHLEYFVQKYQSTLDQFAAEFEIVPDQVGAIVLIDGQVMGIERAPNCDYWQSVWEPLIRMCYGSQAIIAMDQATDPAKPTDKAPKAARAKSRVAVAPSFRIPIGGGARVHFNDLDELEEALDNTEQQETESMKETIRRFIEDEFHVDQEETLRLQSSTVELNTISNQQFVGQIVQDGPAICYASLVTRAGWSKCRAWGEAREFQL